MQAAHLMQPSCAMRISQEVYEVRPRKDKRGVDLICDALPFGRLWYGEPGAISNAIDYAKFRSRSHDALIRVLRCGWQCDRDARARRRFQRAVAALDFLFRNAG